MTESWKVPFAYIEVNMQVHPLVTQLRFARSEFARCMREVSEEDALRRIQSLNCLSWMVGHLANQENLFWVTMAQGQNLFPDLNELTGFRKPPSTPSFEEMWSVWKSITRAADIYLNALAPEVMMTHFEWKGKPLTENVGTMVMRNIYHYWFHTGQALIVRKLLGHSNLPEFVGDMSGAAYSRTI